MVLAALAIMPAGCQGTRFAETQQVREQRIRNLGRTYAAREAVCSDNLHHVLDVHRKFRGHHARRLRQTVQLVGDGYGRDVHRWREQSPARRDYFQGMTAGHPENIRYFIVETVY